MRCELLPAFIAGLIVIIVVSLLTKKPSQDIVDTFEEVKKIVNDLGYEFVSEEYVNCKLKFTLKDIEGYLYYTSFDKINVGKMPLKFNIWFSRQVRSITIC